MFTHRFKTFICLWVVSFLLAPASYADNKIIIGSFSFPPLLHVTEDQGFSGTLTETVYGICEEAELDCTFKLLPLKRAYNDLRNNKVDALVTLNLGQFHDCCYSSDWFSPWSAGFFSNNPDLIIPSKPEDTFNTPFIIAHGMRSPYSFIPKMDEWIDQKKIQVFKGKDIESSIRMFARNRAELLWGGEDFKWYLQKIAPDFTYSYKPLFQKNVVLWIRKDKSHLLSRFNQAYHHLKTNSDIGENGMLSDDLMLERYKEPDIQLR